MPHHDKNISGTVYIGKKEGFDSQASTSPATSEIDDSGLNNLAKLASQVIYETRSVWPPWNMSRNKITICGNRVTMTYSSLLNKYEYPMPVENLTGASVYRDFMFGTLYIDTFGIEKPDPFRYLRINDARLARRYILALIECKKANINLPLNNIDALREKLKDIGMVRIGQEDSEDYHNI